MERQINPLAQAYVGSSPTPRTTYGEMAIEVGEDVFEMNSLKLNSRRLNQSREALVVKEWQRSSWYTDLSAEDGIGA